MKIKNKNIRSIFSRHVPSWIGQLVIGVWIIFLFYIYFNFNYSRFKETATWDFANMPLLIIFILNFFISILFVRQVLLSYSNNKDTAFNFSLLSILSMFFIFSFTFLSYVNFFLPAANIIDVVQLILNNLWLLTEILVPLAISLWVIFLAQGIGEKIFHFFHIKFDEEIKTKIYSFATGLAIIIHIMIFLGLVHLFFKSVAFLIVVALSLWTRKQIWGALLFFKKPIFSIQKRPALGSKNIITFVMLFYFSLIFLGSFSQIIIEYDGLSSVYRFVKNHLEAHYIIQSPYYLLSYFPRDGEMILTLLNLMGGVKSAILFTNLIGFLIITSTGYFISKYARDNRLFFSFAAIILAIPILFANFFERKTIENFYVFFVIISIFCFLEYIKHSDRKKMILAFIFCGLSFSIKYTAILSILSFFPIATYFIFKNKGQLKEKIKYSLLFPIITIILFSPWAVSNYTSTGNPIAPLYINKINNGKTFYEKIGSNCLDYSMETYLRHKEILYLNKEKKDLNYYISLPINAIFFFKGRNYSYLDITPLILLSLPLVFIFWRRMEQSLKIIFVFSAIHLVLWQFFGEGTIWYLLPSLVGFFIIVSFCMIQIKNRKIFQFIIAPILILLVALNVFQAVMDASYKSMLSGKTANESYDADLFSVMRYINKNVKLKDNELIISIYGEPAYYLDNNSSTFLTDFEFEKSGCIFKNNGIGENARQKFSQLGIKYFIAKNNKPDYYEFHSGVPESPFIEKNINDFLDFRDNYLEETYRHGIYSLYKLRE